MADAPAVVGNDLRGPGAHCTAPPAVLLMNYVNRNERPTQVADKWHLGHGRAYVTASTRLVWETLVNDHDVKRA